MSEIENNLNEPFQAPNNGQNQININPPIQNNSSEPYTDSQDIYLAPPAINSINDEDRESLKNEQNIDIQPTPNIIEDNNNFQNNIVGEQINSEIINSQNTNIPIQQEENKIIIPKPFRNNEINEPIVISQNNNIQPYTPINQNLNNAQPNLFISEPFMNPQINNQGQFPQNYGNLITRREPSSESDMICPGTGCKMCCAFCCFCCCLCVSLIFGAIILFFIRL